jgi:hypothetical protein
MREANEDLDKITREIKSAASFPDPAGSTPANARPQPRPYSATPSPTSASRSRSDAEEPGVENSIAPAAQPKKETESETANNA